MMRKVHRFVMHSLSQQECLTTYLAAYESAANAPFHLLRDEKYAAEGKVLLNPSVEVFRLCRMHAQWSPSLKGTYE